MKNRTDEQKIARNNEKSHTAEYKYCAHPSTNAHPPIYIISQRFDRIKSFLPYDISLFIFLPLRVSTPRFKASSMVDELYGSVPVRTKIELMEDR